MQMISTNRIWCDLLKYMSTGPGNHVARIYRIYRHKPTDELLIKMLKYALSKKDQLQQLVHEDERFIAIRRHFSDVASQLTFKEIKITDQMLASLQDYERHKQRFG